MIIRFNQVENYQKAIEALRALNIDFEDDGLNLFKTDLSLKREKGQVEIYEDRMYRWSCPNCDSFNNLEKDDFLENIKENKGESRCSWCGENSKISSIEEY